MKGDAAELAIENALARSKDGDKAAFGDIVRQHQGMVYSLALHFLRDPGVAEELAQEIFLELYRNLAQIKSAAHLRFWLRKVICHRAIDYVRRQGGQRSVSLNDVAEPVASESASDPLLESRLWKLVESLPEKWRMALILRYQEDLSVGEIAETLEMPVNTVKSSLERALATLREKLARSAFIAAL